jgi:orotidine-5'-phosphate decarboxylase
MKERKFLRAEERLIVAADFKPGPKQGRAWVEKQVMDLANTLKGTGVYLKVNSALRTVGYDLIDYIHHYELKVFADLKLYDIPETLAIDGIFLREFKPELLTVVCQVGMPSLQALKAELPDTEVLGVTILTSLKEGDLQSLGYPNQISLDVVVRALTASGMKAGIDGNICSGAEVELVRRVMVEQGKLNATINTPAIRPAWSVVKNDDQNQKRVMTPADAIRAGADRIVVGRPITQAEKPYDAVMRTIEEIASAVG